MKSIKIHDTDNELFKIKEIFIPDKKGYDIAAIVLEENAKSVANTFKLGPSETLDDVLIMGYPPVPGFEAIQVAEKGHISTILKSSTGFITGKEKSYLDNIDYYLVNAKIKGGNSGGPVINNKGLVVGMLVQVPMDSSNTNKLDSLGYGIALPYNVLADFYYQVLDDNKNLRTIKFNSNKDSYSTI